MSRDLSGKSLLAFLRRHVKREGTTLITDEYRAYGLAKRYFEASATINHNERYADGDVHTNSIEGFWGLLKRAWYGSHHHYTEGRMPLYVAEASWKFNRRKDPDSFGTFMRECVAV